MTKVGITGQSGFIGTHLYNYLSLSKDKYELIPFLDEYFDDVNILDDFVSKCQVIVHLAAVNRHHNPSQIYSKNLELVNKLLQALSRTKSKSYIIFSSSTQEERENIYGRSKKEGRNKFIEWAKKNKSGFTGLVMPNVFGPFGRPYYNSVISTFSHQLIKGEEPKIEIDAELKLIYVGELIKVIENVISQRSAQIVDYSTVHFTQKITVTDILNKLTDFKNQYLTNGAIPELENVFEVNLFNTFRSYIDISKYFPYPYKVNTDERGDFVEVIKLYNGGQVSFSTTKPKVTRGNHFHTRKIERFSVIKGKARIQLRIIGTPDIINLELDGETPSFVDMPVWCTHNITNIGKEELLTLFWINEFFNPADPDTFFEIVG